MNFWLIYFQSRKQDGAINYYPSDTTIGSLLFSNYTSEEIRRLSVKELTSSQAIDRLGALVSGKKFCPNCNTSVRSLHANSHRRLFFYSQGISNKQIKPYQRRKRKKIDINDQSIDNVADEEEMLTKIMSSQMYLILLDIYHYLPFDTWSFTFRTLEFMSTRPRVINIEEVLVKFALPRLTSSIYERFIVTN
ncbi:unnamed protein product [Rotaria sp. Silwood2]|nr:unnamed protein product [Rotaria sp. Silwood2]